MGCSSPVTLQHKVDEGLAGNRDHLRTPAHAVPASRIRPERAGPTSANYSSHRITALFVVMVLTAELKLSAVATLPVDTRGTGCNISLRELIVKPQ